MSKPISQNLQNLVDAGTISLEQAVAVENSLHPDERTKSAPLPAMFSSQRAFISEALTYVGFVFVIAAAGLLTSQGWSGLGTWGRPALLAAGSVVLFAAGLWMKNARVDESGRRLSSTLFVGSAALVAGATGLVLNEVWVPKNPSSIDPGSPLWQEPARWVSPAIAIGVALAGVGVGIVGYLLARSALGQLAMAIPSAVLAFGVSQLLIALRPENNQAGPSRIAFAILFAGGLMWIALEHFGRLHEKTLGQVLGIVALFIGLQGMSTDLRVWAASSLLILLGLGVLIFYLQGHAWPYLAGGIVGMFAGGVRLLIEYVHGTSGALSSLGLGILLVFFGVRIVNDRREPTMTVLAESGPDEEKSMPRVGQGPQSINGKFKDVEPF
jgi:hypothetical protein